jgi:uncharacterized phage protein (TIGR01671 family)
MINREIEFRVWISSDKLMIGGVHVHGDKGFILDNKRLGDNDVLMQFINLFDKNEKKIFERDIVRRHTGYTFVVEMKFYSIGGASAFGYEYHKDDVVIGNIYENPELLKELT